MRPVNLIPPEQRRGEQTPLRAGALSYMLVAALALALVAVTGLVLTANQVKDREAEVAALEVREADARARAESLQAFASFAAISEARFATVSMLAASRFDWERVLRELSLVIPDNVWLVSLTASASPEVTVDGSADIALRGEAEGPALSLVGCTTGQEDVAAFIQALEDIDGVTRVGVASSELRTGATAGGDTESDDCRTRDFITRFEVVAAFDEVVVGGIEIPPAPQPDPPAGGSATGVAQAGPVVSGVAR